ncbi:hypothetical protein BGZ51_009254 [Haplosporangium sp. Z 767]|nr:hypothetical protein BGZ50_000638 [Haplosporangium sp. Z 11]KAF9189787.1 hypothetical protein BGZ51_009254 [Haplosporangium sp. Z 767]
MRDQRIEPSRMEPAASPTTPSPHIIEPYSVSLRILCEALEEAHVKRVRYLPPVFLAQTYEQAEMAMQLFTEYYDTIRGGPGPVGFDTETTSVFFSRKKPGSSVIQIATQDICLIFSVYRITKLNTAKKLFPPRLKAFLEDPNQLKVGVGAGNDAKALKSAYGVASKGIINLEAMAKENNVLAASLADLDAMFGRPGREVIKTKALLKWNWDLENLDDKWTWYAAKDAFAGVAIYENMQANKLREGYLPYVQRHPMTESQEAEDIFWFLVRAIGKGRSLQLEKFEKMITKSYPRFHKIYQPSDKAPVIRKYMELLIEKGMIIRKSKEASKPVGPKDVVSLVGRPLSSLLRTPEGANVLSEYFNGQKVDPSTIPATHILKLGEDENQDVADLQLFLKLASLWDRPTTRTACISVYANERARTENQELKGTDIPKVEADQDAAANVMKGFLTRMIRRKVLEVQKRSLTINPEIEKMCSQLVPPSVPRPLPAKRTSDADMLIPDATLAASSETSEMGTTLSTATEDGSRSGSGSSCTALVAVAPDANTSLAPFVKKTRLSGE